MEKILCIIRTSTVQQELISQHNEMNDYCISLGYSSEQIVFVESAGASARKLNEKYLQFIDQIKSTCLSNNINAVAVWHLNRLGRKESKLVELKTWFIDHHINVYVKNPQLQLFDGNKLNTLASMFWNMLAVSIEIDTEELINKTKRGRLHASKQGKFTGGAFGALYGYHIKPDGFIEPDPAEVSLLLQLFTDYSTGKYSYRSLAIEYQSRGIKQRNRKITENWIARTLQCDKYSGSEPSKYAQVIPTTLWNKTRNTAQENSLNLSKETHIHLATKVLKCKYCGHNYVATRNQYTCYKHLMKARFTDQCTESPNINIELMDRIVLHIAKLYHLEFLSQPDTNAIEECNNKLLILQDKLNTNTQQSNNIKQSFDRLREMYVEGDLTKQEYTNKAEGLKARQKALYEAREVLNDEVHSLQATIHNLNNPSPDSFIKLFLDLDNEDNRERLREVVLQHIKVVYLEKQVINNRKCIEIHVHTTNGYEHEFYYYYTLKDKKRQLLQKTGDNLRPFDF